MNIFLYNDYRAWLKESAEELKKSKPFASLRYICYKTDIDPGNLVRVLQGKIHLSRRGASALGSFFRLSKKEQAFFEELIVFSKSRTDKEAWESFERLQALKGVTVRTLADHEFEFFNHWRHTVVRSLISIIDFKDNFQDLAKMLTPAISPAEARQSVALLKKLNMIKQDDAGFWRVTEQFIGSGQKWAGRGVQNFQASTLALARESLERHAAEIRDVSTITITMPRREMPALKSRIKEFRKELLSMAKGFEDDDSVYHMNISLFPVGLADNRGVR